MEDYLKIFKDKNEYNACEEKPAYSHLVNEASLKKEKPYEQQYLTFDIIEGGDIVWYTVNSNVTRTIEYSLDDGETWNRITSSSIGSATFTVNAGDKVLFKGTNNDYGDYPRDNKFFHSTIKYNVYGNIMSMFYGDDFIGKDEFPSGTSTISGLFKQTNVVEAKNLVLPAKTMTYMCYASMFGYCSDLVSVPKLPSKTTANRCYSAMFIDCTSLETAPDLPATKLGPYCYLNMFNGCSNLKYIKMMATDFSGTGCLENWVSGVAGNGTFVKNSETTWSTRGTSGIPNNWTVKTASS